MVLPKAIKQFFWDVDVHAISSKNSGFVITRLADKGSLNANRWLVKNFGKKKIKNTIKSSRNVSAKTKNFWSIV